MNGWSLILKNLRLHIKDKFCFSTLTLHALIRYVFHEKKMKWKKLHRRIVLGKCEYRQQHYLGLDNGQTTCSSSGYIILPEAIYWLDLPSHRYKNGLLMVISPTLSPAKGAYKAVGQKTQLALVTVYLLKDRVTWTLWTFETFHILCLHNLQSIFGIIEFYMQT